MVTTCQLPTSPSGTNHQRVLEERVRELMAVYWLSPAKDPAECRVVDLPSRPVGLDEALTDTRAFPGGILVGRKPPTSPARADAIGQDPW